MSDQTEKRFKQVTADLYRKINDDDLGQIIKYLRKSFHFCDIAKLDKSKFEETMQVLELYQDRDTAKKAIKEFCQHLKEIRDQSKVKSYVPKSGESAASSPGRSPVPSVQHPVGLRSSQPTEMDLQQLELSLKQTDISIPLTTASDLSPQVQEAVSAPAPRKRKIELIPISKNESERQSEQAPNPFRSVQSPNEPSLEEAIDPLPSKIARTTSDADDAGEFEDANEEQEYLTVKEAKALKKIEQMDKYLQERSNKIKKLESDELNILEVNDENERATKSLYLDKLKANWIRVYQRLIIVCNKYPQLVDPECLKELKFFKDARFKYKIKVNVTKYPVINQEATDFINKNREMPNFSDINTLVESTSKSKGLNLNEIEMQNVAMEIHSYVVKELKKRRIKDDLEIQDTRTKTLSESVPSTSTDPANADPELKKRLEESKAQGDLAESKIFSEFTSAQGDKEDSEGEPESKEEEEEEEDDEDTENTSTSYPTDEQTEGEEESESTSPLDEPPESPEVANSQDSGKPASEETKQENTPAFELTAGFYEGSCESEPEPSAGKTLSDFLADSNDETFKEDTETGVTPFDEATPDALSMRTRSQVKAFSFTPPSAKTKLNQRMPLALSKLPALTKTAPRSSNVEEPIVID